MSLDAASIYSFGSQAMRKSDIVHIVLEQDDEDLLKILAILDSHDLSNLGGLNVVFEIDLELLKPDEEIFS